MADENTLLNSDLESRYEKYKGIIKNFTLMSDIFMRNVFKKRECLEYVLQVIMEKQDLHVIDQIIQKDYKNLQGRSAVMDCVARDSTGKQFDVEIQQDNEGASPKRARYHSGLMDMNTLNPGQDFEELPESYVIFITRDDILGYGLPIYHIDRQIKELNEAFQDEAHIIYVNSRKQDDTELGRLMHDLHCKKADEMHSPILAKRVYELKETQSILVICQEKFKIVFDMFFLKKGALHHRSLIIFLKNERYLDSVFNSASSFSPVYSWFLTSKPKTSRTNLRDVSASALLC